MFSSPALRPTRKLFLCHRTRWFIEVFLFSILKLNGSFLLPNSRTLYIIRCRNRFLYYSLLYVIFSKNSFLVAPQHQACAVVLKSECKGTAFTNNLQTFPILFWRKNISFPKGWQKEHKTHIYIILRRPGCLRDRPAYLPPLAPKRKALPKEEGVRATLRNSNIRETDKEQKGKEMKRKRKEIREVEKKRRVRIRGGKRIRE